MQDEERRHLARELHDEFGQSLTAIAAQAASAAHTAERECPPLLEECRGISRITAGLMATLRGALVRLRPPDIEELGLALSLESLVASWRASRRAAPDMTLPSSARSTICRPASAQVSIASRRRRSPMSPNTPRPGGAVASEAGEADIVLSVEDDGKAIGDHFASKAGMGFLGMQERVVSLGGTLRWSGRRLAAPDSSSHSQYGGRQPSSVPDAGGLTA